MNKDTIIVFFDNLGRVVIGVLANESTEQLFVQNPTVLHAQIGEGNRIQVSLVPAFFREYLSDWNKPLVFAYNKSAITIEQDSTSGAILDEKVMEQYNAVWSARPSREEVRKKAAAKTPPVSVEAKPVDKLNLFESVTPTVSS
jgi:hypothetical protein